MKTFKAESVETDEEGSMNTEDAAWVKQYLATDVWTLHLP